MRRWRFATAPPSSTPRRGFGFVSEQPVETIEISSSEAGDAILGYFTGLVAGDPMITWPNNQACPNAACDYAAAYDIHRPRTFVTPSAGPGDLSLWNEVELGVGAAARDEICAYWAGQLGYQVPQRFVAVIGEGTTHPFCRAVGLTGPYSGACGGLPFPARLARWWRVDGLPWGTLPPSQTVIVPDTLRPSLDTTGERVDDLTSPARTRTAPAATGPRRTARFRGSVVATGIRSPARAAPD